MMIRHILLKRENNLGSVVDIVSVWKVLSVFCLVFVLFVGCGEPNLDDPKVREKIIAEAIEYDKLQTRKSPSGEELRYAPNQEQPYTGWIKTNWTLQQFQNGKSNGLYIEWYESGQNEEKGTMRNGTKDGRWTFWYENGQKEREGTYKNGERNGLWTEWYTDGAEKSKGNYKAGKKDGAWTFSYQKGNTLASGSSDKTIRLWEVRREEHLRTLTGHTDEVISVAFSPDGNTLASGSSDKTIRLWDIRSGEPPRTLTGHTDWVFSVSFSSDGQIAGKWESGRDYPLVGGQHG